ncbi:MAG: hypothetical protein V3T24_05425 [Longimicrobiales bacterium]
MLAGTAHAQVPTVLDVRYNSCTVLEGPLSLGLDQLPTTIHARFEFELPSIPPPTGRHTPTVTAATASIGDAQWNETQLQNFTLTFTQGDEIFLSELNYDFAAIDTGTAQGFITLNFPLTVSGTDTASGDDFVYECAGSVHTLNERVANPVPVRLDVTYSACEITEGPLSLGLAELPASIDVAFEFELPSLPAPEGTRRPFVTAASISLGDASWDEQDIQFFQLGFDATGTLNALTYFTGPIDTGTTLGLVVLNFPLTVSGTDTDSGQPFSYSCPESEQTITERGATPIPVQLDVSYSVCEVLSGPLSLGLTELPATIDASFQFSLDRLPPPLGEQEPQVTSASLSVGDAAWDENDLQNFQLIFGAAGALTGLTYDMLGIDTGTTLGALTANNNFALTVEGTDIASGNSFEYFCPESTDTLTPVLTPVQLDVVYGGCEIVEGPLSAGLSELPETFHATFQFGVPTLPAAEGDQEPVVTYAAISVGDASWNEADLPSEPLVVVVGDGSVTLTPLLIGFDAFGSLNALTYGLRPIDTASVLMAMTFNNDFALTVLGTDIASGNSFEYSCPESEQTITEREVSCSSGPLVGCLAPGGSGKSQLQIKDQDADGPGSKDKIQWKWLKGPALSQADFGDPVDPNGPDFKLCIYAGAPPLVIVEMQVPAGGTCGTKACWKPISTKGYKYGDKGLASDGVKKLLLKCDVAGKSKILIQGKDGNLPLPTLPLDSNGPVIAQLSSSDPSLPCYEETFLQSNVTKNVAKQFKAKTP